MIFAVGTGPLDIPPAQVYKWSARMPKEDIAVAAVQNDDGSVEVEMALTDGRDLLLGISPDGTFELTIYDKEGDGYIDVPVVIPDYDATSGGNQTITQSL